MKAAFTISLGAIFGSLLITSQAFHWYRIQEMFHFESFHMFGLLGSAILTGALSVFFLKKYRVKSVSGAEIKPKRKAVRPVGNIVGGLFFGVGWAITGACTAPIFILSGWNWQIGLWAIAGALLGTLIYAVLIKILPK